MDADPELNFSDLVEKHPELHHYTTEVGMEGILNSNTIWATSYKWLNDAAETRLLHKHLKSALEIEFRSLILEKIRESFHARRQVTKAGGIVKTASAESKNLTDALYKVSFSDETHTAFMEPCIASFCSHSGDKEYERVNGLLSQWRGYGGRVGYCIVLDTRPLFEMLNLECGKYYWSHVSARDVAYVYDSFRLVDTFPDLMQICQKFYLDFLNKRMPNMTAGFDMFVVAATYMKHQGFREEREVRIVACPATERTVDLVKAEHPGWDPHKPLKPTQMRLHQRGRAPYISLFSELECSLPIKRVIVGPSRNQKENYDMTSRLLNGRCDVVCSETPYMG